MTADHYDAIVIGSGQGGTPLCRALAEAGIRTALIERDHVGGTCINEGCTPTKTMIASARVASLAGRGAGYGVLHTGDPRIDMKRVRQRKRDIVNSFRTGAQKRLEKTANLDLIFGEASFTGPDSLLVKRKDGGQRSVTGTKFFINAGARPSVPAVDGLKDVPFLDSTSIMEVESVPEHLLVLGGGYVGLEFAQMFRRFGSRVTIVQSRGQLLTREDADVARGVAAILERGWDPDSAQRQRFAREPDRIADSSDSSHGERVRRHRRVSPARGHGTHSEYRFVERGGGRHRNGRRRVHQGERKIGDHPERHLRTG